MIYLKIPSKKTVYVPASKLNNILLVYVFLLIINLPYSKYRNAYSQLDREVPSIPMLGAFFHGFCKN